MNIVVIGGGIGGLSVALACARDGHDVVIVERARDFGEVGAGIQISPNGMRVLDWLGLVDDHLSVATIPDRVVIRRWQDDRIIGSTELGEAVSRRHGQPYTNVYRPDLVDVLARGVARIQERRPGSIEIRFGVEPTAIDDGRDDARDDPLEHVTIQLSKGDRIDTHLVIGADGVHSVTRRHLVEIGALDETPSRFSGYVAYRALVPRESVSDLPAEVTNRLGPDRHVVTYFVGKDRRLLNLVAFVPEANWTLESWTEPGRLEELARWYESWSPELTRILERVETPVYRWAMHDREPLPRWSDGRITLLGDSCHPMLPFMAQGGCQALEDAAVLTRCLHGIDPADGSALTSALSRYERIRRARTDVVQKRSWRNATVFHLPDGPDQERRDADLADRSPLEALAANDWLYSYDAVTTDLP